VDDKKQAVKNQAEGCGFIPDTLKKRTSPDHIVIRMFRPKGAADGFCKPDTNTSCLMLPSFRKESCENAYCRQKYCRLDSGWTYNPDPSRSSQRVQKKSESCSVCRLNGMSFNRIISRRSMTQRQALYVVIQHSHFISEKR